MLLHGDHRLPEQRSAGVPLAPLVHRGAPPRGLLGDANQAEEVQEVVVADPAPREQPRGPADAGVLPSPPQARLPLAAPGADDLHHPAGVAGAFPAIGKHQHQGPLPGLPVLRLFLGFHHDAEHGPSARRRPGSGRAEDMRRFPVEVRPGRTAARRQKHRKGHLPQLCARGHPCAGLLLKAPHGGGPIGKLRLRPHKPHAEELLRTGRRLAAVDHELAALDDPGPHGLIAAHARRWTGLHELAVPARERHAPRADVAVEARLDFLQERRRPVVTHRAPVHGGVPRADAELAQAGPNGGAGRRCLLGRLLLLPLLGRGLGPRDSEAQATALHRQLGPQRQQRGVEVQGGPAALARHMRRRWDCPLVELQDGHRPAGQDLPEPGVGGHVDVPDGELAPGHRSAHRQHGRPRAVRERSPEAGPSPHAHPPHRLLAARYPQRCDGPGSRCCGRMHRQGQLASECGAGWLCMAMDLQRRLGIAA
mmetsp:Transcript_68611/g.204156  ORF Transcript_68611/g.204156 Transcript_68611/m.204156 type:complete len:479 (-) Transcript_68611:170-1606(-)